MTGEKTDRIEIVVIRLSAEQRAALEGAARGEGVEPARLAQVFINYGVERLAAGDAGFKRAVKGSRDSSAR